mmetsp:Transcript_41266/g.103161  ORF Transcript_41266/g.103161 Transcript_41266/m.103161 type:complete len:150 (-) Transcript_41266:26-475(-)
MESMDGYKEVAVMHTNPRSTAGIRILSVLDEKGEKAAIKVYPKASVGETRLRRLRDKKRLLSEASGCPFIERLLTTFQDADKQAPPPILRPFYPCMMHCDLWPVSGMLCTLSWLSLEPLCVKGGLRFCGACAGIWHSAWGVALRGACSV